MLLTVCCSAGAALLTRYISKELANSLGHLEEYTFQEGPLGRVPPQYEFDEGDMVLILLD